MRFPLWSVLLAVVVLSACGGDPAAGGVGTATTTGRLVVESYGGLCTSSEGVGKPCHRKVVARADDREGAAALAVASRTRRSDVVEAGSPPPCRSAYDDSDFRIQWDGPDGPAEVDTCVVALKPDHPLVRAALALLRR